MRLAAFIRSPVHHEERGRCEAMTGQRHAPGNRAAPVMPDNREVWDGERIGQQEHIANQLVGRVGLDRLRFRRATIAALIGRDAAVAIPEMRDLVAPGAVAFGKAVEENQRRRISGTFVDHIQMNPIGQRHALLFKPAHSAASSFSM